MIGLDCKVFGKTTCDCLGDSGRGAPPVYHSFGGHEQRFPRSHRMRTFTTMKNLTGITVTEDQGRRGRDRAVSCCSNRNDRQPGQGCKVGRWLTSSRQLGSWGPLESTLPGVSDWLSGFVTREVTAAGMRGVKQASQSFFSWLTCRVQTFDWFVLVAHGRFGCHQKMPPAFCEWMVRVCEEMVHALRWCS